MSTIRPEFHSNLASQLLNDIFYRRSNYFYFLGKIDAWENDAAAPPAPNNSFEQDNIIRDNILYIRRIAPSEISLVTKKYSWTSGSTYVKWDHKVELQDSPFYCITDDFNVYKCLDNYGTPSTVKPAGNSLFPFRTSDGYLWKYMYNVPSFKRTKFLSHGNLPVQKALTDTFYNKGAIEQVVVTAEGSGYNDEQQTVINVTGDTTGSGAEASISSIGPLGQITGITIDNAGSGYTAGALVTVNSSTGTGAVIKIVAVAGEITNFTIVNAGYGYTLSDTIDITVGGAIVIPKVSFETGSITDIIIVNGGAGYTETPTLTIVQAPPALGTGKYGNPSAVLTPVLYQGSLVNVTIEDPGVNYPSDNATTIVVSGDGTGAVFSPVIYEGKLVDIIVENPGANYSYASLSIVGAGTGATANAVIATSDFISDQSLVEQVAVRGAIYSITVTNPGNNYSTETTVSFVGDGSGAAGYPVIGQNGSITRIVMTSYGSGYNNVQIVLNDPNRIASSNLIDFEGYAVLPPVMGHGYDAVEELYADTIGLFTTVKDDVELTLLQQDYRQYGLLINPTDLYTTKRVITDINFIAFTVTVNSSDSISPDDIVINNHKRYRIVSINGNEVKLQQLNSNYSIPNGSCYVEGDVSNTFNIQQVVSKPSVNKYSGNLVYVTNNEPFTPTTEQSIAIRTYIKL